MYDYKVGKPATDAWISSLVYDCSFFLFGCSPRFCVLLHLLASSSSRFIFSLLLLAFSSLASFACLFFSLFFSHFLLFSLFHLLAVSSHFSLFFLAFLFFSHRLTSRWEAWTHRSLHMRSPCVTLLKVSYN